MKTRNVGPMVKTDRRKTVLAHNHCCDHRLLDHEYDKVKRLFVCTVPHCACEGTRKGHRN